MLWTQAWLTSPNSTANTSSNRFRVAAELLLDTGAIVTLLDRAQRRHREFAEFFGAWTGEVVTTEAVLTESTHLLGRVHGGTMACLDFILAGGALLIPSTASSLRRARDLMQRYADCPMDFADATLVVLGEDLETDHILTTDQHGFSVYRIGDRGRFRMCI